MWSNGEARDRYGRNQSYRSINTTESVDPGWHGDERVDPRFRWTTQRAVTPERHGDAVSDNRVVIPAGTPVEGVVTSSVQGTHSTRPSVESRRRASVDGSMRSMNAVTEPIVAGSDRAKKIGVIAGSAAVGALLGHGGQGQPRHADWRHPGRRRLRPHRGMRSHHAAQARYGIDVHHAFRRVGVSPAKPARSEGQRIRPRCPSFTWHGLRTARRGNEA